MLQIRRRWQRDVATWRCWYRESSWPIDRKPIHYGKMSGVVWRRKVVTAWITTAFDCLRRPADVHATGRAVAVLWFDNWIEAWRRLQRKAVINHSSFHSGSTASSSSLSASIPPCWFIARIETHLRWLRRLRSMLRHYTAIHHGQVGWDCESSSIGRHAVPCCLRRVTCASLATCAATHVSLFSRSRIYAAVRRYGGLLEPETKTDERKSRFLLGQLYQVLQHKADFTFLALLISITHTWSMHHLTFGISSLLYSVNLILFSVLLVHLVLRT